MSRLSRLVGVEGLLARCCNAETIEARGGDSGPDLHRLAPRIPLLLPMYAGRIQPNPGAFAGLRGRDMAEKLRAVNYGRS